MNGIDLIADTQETLPGNNITHTEYQNSSGKTLIESWLIPEMKHGTPIAIEGNQKCGEESDYIIDEGICAVRQISIFWSLNY